MKIVIDIPEERYNRIKYLEPKENSNSLLDVLMCAVQHGTPLPKTNGEVLMTMFPPSVYYGKDKRLVLFAKDTCLECTNDDWWNAEYKGETE